MGKYLSRSKRLTKALSVVQDRIDELQAIVDEVQNKPGFEAHQSDKEITLDEPADPSVDVGEIQDLLDEIEEWKGNMEGTNLETTQKYSDLEDCAGQLQDGIDTLESLTEVDTFEDLESVISDIQQAMDELESVEFPGMY